MSLIIHTNKQILYHYALYHVISNHIISYQMWQWQIYSQTFLYKYQCQPIYSNINNKWQVTIKKIIWFLERHKWETSFNFIRNLQISMKYWILNVEITDYPYIILIIYQQSSHLISFHLVNILLTMFIHLIDNFI